MDNIIIDLKRVDNRVHFEAVSAAHPALKMPFDYTPPLGTDAGFAGLEALIMAFSGCVSTAIVALLMRAGKHIEQYSVHAEGVRREQPLSLSKILFQVKLSSPDITSDDLETVLRQAEQISPVWIAIKNNVEVEVSYELA